MILTVLAIAAAFTVAVLYLLFVTKGRKKDDPPTPGWLPLVGSLPYLEAAFEEQLQEQFSKEPVVVLHYGLERMYCFNTYEALHEALVTQGDKFLARPSRIARLMRMGEEAGIAMANGKQWVDYRRFTLKTLRDLGFGRQGSEQIISSEVQLLCETIDAAGVGTSIDTAPLMSSAISNVICQLVFGARLASEPEFHKMLQFMKAVLQSQNNRNRNFTMLLNAKYLLSMPMMPYILNSIRQGQLSAFSKLSDFCQRQADKHRQELQEGTEPRDYIEAHLLHQRTHEGFNDMRLTASIVDLFIAGTDTTSHTLRWAILQNIANPRVEERVFKEIFDIIGTERSVTMKDKSDMHYTLATLEEVHRCASLASNGVIHECTEDATVCGYRIPAGSAVIYNVYNIHKSENHFPEPSEFRPERFLDSEGHFSNDEHVVSFGVGKRACLGETLARMELFMFYVTLVQRYRITLDPSDSRSLKQIMQKESKASGLRAPLEHSLVFTRR